MPQLMTKAQKIDTVRNMLVKHQPQIELALPRHMSSETMVRIALTSCLRNPKLLDCMAESMVGAILQSSQIGLYPDDVRGLAFLVPFKNNKKGIMECQLMPGYLGLMELALDADPELDFTPGIVYEWDNLKYQEGLNPILEHRPADPPDPKDEAEKRAMQDSAFGITHFYMIARRGDRKNFKVMTRKQVERHRDQYSRAATGDAWVNSFGPMGLKTVFKQLVKWIKKSPRLARAIALDDAAEAGIPQNLGDVIDITPEPVDEKKGLDKLAESTTSHSRQPDITADTNDAPSPPQVDYRPPDPDKGGTEHQRIRHGLGCLCVRNQGVRRRYAGIPPHRLPGPEEGFDQKGRQRQGVPILSDLETHALYAIHGPVCRQEPFSPQRGTMGGGNKDV